LGFQPALGGGFFPTLDYLPLGHRLRATGYTIIAMPESEAGRHSLAAPPPRFSVDLVEPTLVSFLNDSFDSQPVFFPPSHIIVRVKLGRDDTSRLSTNTTLEVKLITPDESSNIALQAYFDASGL